MKRFNYIQFSIITITMLIAGCESDAVLSPTMQIAKEKCEYSNGIFNKDMTCQCSNNTTCKKGNMGQYCSSKNKCIDIEFEENCKGSGGTINNDAKCVCNNEECGDNKVCNTTGSCDKSQEDNMGGNFQIMCMNSGGNFNNNRCECKDDTHQTCDEGVICTKQCSNDKTTCSENEKLIVCAGHTGDSFEKMCISSGGKYTYNEKSKEARCICKEVICDHGVVCSADSNGCAGHTGDSFEKMCVSSGGSIDNGNCLCNNMICDKGVVCTTSRFNDQKTCANKFGNCSSDDENELRCVDDNNYMCVKNVLNNDKNTTNYEWLFVSKCEKGCNDNKCKDTCSKEETSCSENYDFLLRCSNNSRGVEYCPLGCDSDSKKCNELECDHDDIYQCNDGVLQVCKNYKWVNDESCLYSCTEDDKGVRCGICNNGNTRCKTEDQGTRGIPQTCKNGEWKNDKGDDKCTADNCLCDDNASCTITKESRDDGTEVEKSTCGICQNDVDISCVYDSKEQPPRTGYRASCKNGLLKKIDTDVCPNGNSCKISKELTKCELNSCECGSGKEKDNCSRGQYCKEELLDGAIHRKCVNAMSRCEENMCICGNVVCNRGEFCTVDEELNDACVSALKCEDSECTCGKNKCKTGEYCRDSAICVDASEVITGIDWACGDCRNTVSDKDKYPVTLNQCGTDTGQDDCHTSALKIMDQDVIRDCMNSDTFEQCIEKSFHAACDIQSCKTKANNCDKVLSQCYDKYHNRLEQFKKCGIKQETLYLAIKQSDKCEQESCDCGSQSCLKGQFCLNDMECVDGDKIDFVGILDFDKKKLSVCQCSGSECKCSCGDQECSRRQICVGDSTSTQTCEYSSSMNFTYVYKCQDKTCPNCNKEDNCCDKEGKCIDYSDTEKFVSVYEFMDSEEYVCRTLEEQCDAYLDEQTNCLEDSYSEYKVCLLNCTDSETKDKCQKACIEQRSNRDDDCLNMTLDLVKPIKDLGDIESGCFYKEESNTSCSYECRSGRRMPFNGIDACSSEL